MAPRLNYSGLVIAGIGFFTTRFTVTLAISQDPARFYLAGVVPLVLGLGLAAFGVALTVSNLDRSLVRTTAIWCVIGFGTMLVLGLLTQLGSEADSSVDLVAALSQTYLSNFLIGGSVGGTFTGLYAAHSQRQQRELFQQASRLKVLNRLLRHEILNAVTVIRGTAALDRDATPEARDVIVQQSDDIHRTIEEVKYLARSTARDRASRTTIDPARCIEASLDTIRRDYPAVDVSVETPATEMTVRGNDRLEQAITHLLENAIVYTPDDESTVHVAVSATANTVRISVTDEGPGLPAAQRALLETGTIDEFDNPAIGFGLNIVRLTVESFDGTIETDAGPDGTTITLLLDRVATTSDHVPLPASIDNVRPAIPQLLVTFVAALVAGVVYGVVAEFLGGSVAFIGVYYGVRNPLVGWITHEFHSIVFGFVFAALVSLLPVRYRTNVPAYVAVGIAWGVVLWIVAAGVISPLWLNLVDIPASIPSFNRSILVSHLAWGVSLGICTALGYEHVAPRLSKRGPD